MQRPPRLRPGDAIGVIAPAGPVPEAELNAGVETLRMRGYRVEVGAHVLDRLPDRDYLAGHDAARAEDLNAMLARDDIRAVFCARGGYGSMRLFPLLRLEEAARRPRIFTGYSDITSLHLALTQGAGQITFHGPNLTALPRLDAVSSELFWRLLEAPEPYGALPAPPEAITTLVGGCAVGELAGGNLCLLAHACGSRFTPDLRDKIVLIEDVNEAVYRADRDLMQLRNAGCLDGVAGFVVGTLTGWRKAEADPPRNNPDVLWQDFLAPLGKPTIVGFPFGHEPNPLTLPLGVRACLDADARTLTLLEPAVT
jgi:muramoyltetrapeptide carboxypeptidase